MNRRRGLIALAVASLLSTASLGAGASAGERWGGLYIGAHVGHAWSDLDWKLDYPFGNPPPSTTFDLDHVVGGGQIGLQHQFGNWVVGAEATFSGNLGSRTVSGVDLWAPTLGTLKTEIDWLVTATARLGYAWNNWLG